MDNNQLLALALRCGASLAGIANGNDLRMSPSYRDFSVQTLPGGVRSVLVLALHHPRTRPALDYWGGEGGTRGNLSLIRMARVISVQAEYDLDILATPLDYSPTNRGTFLKDAAVLAGMGSIGKNNLLITPEYGPRVRLLALALNKELQPAEGSADFDPCSSCAMPCREICPQAAFWSNRYDRPMCKIQMKIDESAPQRSANADGYYISYCRKCELACSIGETEVGVADESNTARDSADAPPVS